MVGPLLDCHLWLDSIPRSSPCGSIDPWPIGSNTLMWSFLDVSGINSLFAERLRGIFWSRLWPSKSKTLMSETVSQRSQELNCIWHTVEIKPLILPDTALSHCRWRFPALRAAWLLDWTPVFGNDRGDRINCCALCLWHDKVFHNQYTLR